MNINLLHVTENPALIFFDIIPGSGWTIYEDKAIKLQVRVGQF